MGNLDVLVKIVLREAPEDILALAFPGAHLVGRAEETEAALAFRVDADKVLRIRLPGAGGAAGEEVLLDIEAEAEPTSDIARRAYRYATFLQHHFSLPVRSLVLFLHRAADGRRPPPVYRAPLGENPLPFRYLAQRLYEMPVEPVLADRRPGLLALVPFLAGSTIAHGLRAWQALREAPIAPDKRQELLLALYLAGGALYDEVEWNSAVREEEIVTSKTYQSILEKGIEKGREKGRAEGREEGRRLLLLRQTTIRFGEACAAEVASLLERIKDPEGLEQAGDSILRCDTAAAFVEGIAALAGPAAP